MNKQGINGDHNQQAGGNIVNIQHDKTPCLNADNPNAVTCPQCYETVGRFSEMCSTRNCGLAVRKYFDELDKKNKADNVRSIFTKIFFSAAIFILLGLWFTIPMMTIGGIITCIIAIKVIEP